MERQDIHESYVSLETAQLLKYAGFDWPVMHFYDEFEDGKIPFYSRGAEELQQNMNAFGYYSAPTLSVAQKWLREAKGYILEITAVRKNPDDAYKTYIEYWYNIFEEGKCGHYDTYEEALEAGIKKCLTLILEKDE